MMVGLLVVAVLLCASLSLGSVVVTVNVHYPGPAALTIRGDSCGLSWYTDTPLAPTSSHTRFTTQLSCNASVQLLSFKSRNGGVWQVRN
jgi:hypothetical protein